VEDDVPEIRAKARPHDGLLGGGKRLAGRSHGVLHRPRGGPGRCLLPK
jgi:hypothetical protein